VTRLVVVSALLLAAGCGKKGPPLAPLVRIPAAVEEMSAQRVGSEVYVTLVVPSANVDRFSPADIERVEVFGYTGRTPPPRARFAESATLVATVPVLPPPPPGGEKPPEVPPEGAAQGAQVTIRDTLTPEDLVPGQEARPAVAAGNREPAAGNPEPAAGNREPGARNSEPGTTNAEPGTGNVEPAMLRRFYIAYAWSPRGRVGPPSSVAELPLLPLPDPPASVAIDYSEDQMVVTWEPSGGLIGFLLERLLPEELIPFDLGEPPAAAAATQPGSPTYNVYRTAVPDPFAPPQGAPAAQAWTARPPVPLNGAPLAALTFTDSIEFGEERCYSVRSVRGAAPDVRIGDPSPPACVTPVDTFAPAPPTGLATVASQGAIDLIWEPSTDADLRGYVVLRGEAPDATLQPLTPAPIGEASYRDATVTSGVRYVYAVVAVDNRFPVPNVSAASTPVEETAR